MKTVKNVVVSFIILIALWEMAYLAGGFEEALFPAPLQAGKALIEMFIENSLYIDIASSMKRFLIGYLSAVISGILLGLMFGRLPKVFQYVNPIVQLLRPISPIAWLPFIVLWFGIGDIPAIVIIFIAAFFPVLLSTVTAVRNVDAIYLKLARNFEINNYELLIKIIFPSAFPQIATSLHLALGSAWVFLVAGEMSGAQSGLGYLIIDARNNLRMDILLGTILVIGFIGLLLDGGIKVLERLIMTTWGVSSREGE